MDPPNPDSRGSLRYQRSPKRSPQKTAIRQRQCDDMGMHPLSEAVGSLILIKIIHINRTIVFMWRDHADNSSNPHEELVAACTTYLSVKQFAIPTIASMCPRVFLRTWPNQTCWPQKVSFNLV